MVALSVGESFRSFVQDGKESKKWPRNDATLTNGCTNKRSLYYDLLFSFSILHQRINLNSYVFSTSYLLLSMESFGTNGKFLQGSALFLTFQFYYKIWKS